jgi:aminoglycoside phosphotransferase (APT) family kinase protein
MFEANKRRQIEKLSSSVNDNALCQVVAGLTGGKTCVIDYDAAYMGGANYHPRIVFDDHSPSWLVRMPRGGAWPIALEECLVRSEYATLKYLEGTKVPSPKAYGFGIRGCKDNPIGVSYLLMEEMPGQVWYEGRAAESSARRDLEKVYNGLADIMIELHRHPLDKIGSLQCGPSGLQISEVASDQTLVLGPSGPFRTTRDYYTSYAEQYLALIADEQTYTNFPVEAYLIYAFLKDNVSQLCTTPSDQREHFFLKHVDDKGDHLMVDEELNIVGVIDWQMARSAPANEAFGPSLVTADMNSLCGGKYGLTIKDRLLADILRQKGAAKLADIMFDNEKVRRFIWGLGAETDWKYAAPQAKAILEVFGGGKSPGWEEWREKELQMRHGDARLKNLIRQIQDRS